MAAPFLNIALDTETFRISDQDTLPRAICASMAWRDEDTGEMRTWLVSDGDTEFEEMMRGLLTNPRARLIFLGLEYDLGVLGKTFPKLVPAICACLAEGRAIDVGHREKLLRLSNSGRIGQPEEYDENGESRKVSYSLGELEMAYWGRDRSATKADEDSVRQRFGELSGTPASGYPDEFRTYALEDAVSTLLVFEAQELVPGSTATQEDQARAAWALRLATDHGILLDPDEVESIGARVAEELTPEKMRRLIRSGVLRSPVPYANGQRAHVEGCPKKKTKGQWACDCPVKLSHTKAGTIDQGLLHKIVFRACRRTGKNVQLTDKGKEKLERVALKPDEHYPTKEKDGRQVPLYVSTEADFLQELAPHSKIIEEYLHRQSLGKIANQALPAFRSALERGGVIHANYNVLVDSGRTSSYGNKKGVEPGKPGNLFPSEQAQNMPRVIAGIDVRLAHVARPEHVFVAADYTSLELCCVGQQIHEVFPGQVNRHRELLNSGVELHSYLATHLAYEHSKGPIANKFRRAVRRHFDAGDPIAATAEFMRWRKADEEEVRAWAKEQRAAGKVFGLSLPGGVGAKKIAFGMAPGYGLSITLEDARRFVSTYHKAYPEMAPYFRWLKEAGRDAQNPGMFAYQSVGGFVRRGATFTAAANGLSMQTRGAFGAKAACWEVQRACVDASVRSILYGGRLVLFVHDELWVEVREDAVLNHYQAEELSRIMVRAMRERALPDVEISADPFLARRISKDAGEYGPDLRDMHGRLIPWDRAA